VWIVKISMDAFAHAPDVFIVGGGPAGLAAAIAASRRGFAVTVADHAYPPINKTCGEGLMPDTLAALSDLGVNLDAGEGAPFAGISFLDSEAKASVQARFLGSVGLGIRRTVLHTRLIECAERAGVQLLWGARVEARNENDIRCNGSRITARWIIGADGESSQIRKLVTRRPPRYRRTRFGFRRHFRAKPWSEFVEVYWSHGVQLVVAPVANATSRHPCMALRDTLARFPDLARRIESAETVGRGQGARAGLTRLRSVHRARFALIGDASGSVDPLTGEGLGLAFKQAFALAEALDRGDLSAYQAAHDQVCCIPRLTSKLMLLMDSRPWLRRRVLRVLADEPNLFSRLLNTHVREISPASFGTRNALRLGWRLLMPGWQS
jgi:2-polyprenyl-6-methoxyphenol hydroxylase-like FAD-dependent oxidoreductase